jgi:L-seryl-tRNA(Ser) seleniumtransferase
LHRAVESIAEVAQGCLQSDEARKRVGLSVRLHVGLPGKLSGAESALVVNNNAAAVLVVLNTLAQGHEAIVSRGELIEIGGSFRLPDIMRQSGCALKEVGTTNKTKLSDYEQAISQETRLFLTAHTSNYRILGFTEQVPLKDLVGLGRTFNIP